MAAHEGLGEGLGAFELRSCLGGAKNAQSMGTKLVHDTCGQRRFGAYDRQADFFGLGPGTQRAYIRDRYVFHLGTQRRAAIARRHIHPGDLGGLREFPGHRVFTASATNYKNFHTRLQHADPMGPATPLREKN